MVHGFIRRPVIFRAVDLSGLQGLINLIKCHRHGNSSQGVYDIIHQVRLRCPDAQACQVFQTRNRPAGGIEGAGPRIVPGERDKGGIVKLCHEHIAQLPVQNLPHMFGILVQIRHLEKIELGKHIGQGCQGKTGEINPPEFQLLHHGRLVAQGRIRMDLDFHLAVGSLPYQLRKMKGGPCGGIVLGLIFRIGQHIFRLHLKPVFFAHMQI